MSRRTPPPLTPAQRSHLRTLAHHLDPVVQVGVAGATPAVLRQLSEALQAHELIKVKLGKECPVDLATLAALAEQQAGAQQVQRIGRVLILFRRRTKKPGIELPGEPPRERPRAKPEKRPAAAPARPGPTRARGPRRKPSASR